MPEGRLALALRAPGVALSRSVRRVPWDDRSDAVVKETPRRVLALMRTSRARRAHDAALVLEAAGVPTAEPLGCVEESARSFFVARFVLGEALPVLKQGEEAASLAARIHAAHVEHGDFKPANLIVAPQGIVVLDLDAARIHGGIPSQRARARDLGALVAYAERLGGDAKTKRAIVLAYLEAAPFEEDREGFERAVLARSRAKLSRWARA